MSERFTNNWQLQIQSQKAALLQIQKKIATDFYLGNGHFPVRRSSATNLTSTD
jgi:hypothetical protein